jgi:hypothetical protein
MCISKPSSVAAVLAMATCAFTIAWVGRSTVTIGNDGQYRIAVNNARGIQSYEYDH